ncbi:MAG: ABC transporter ATP-binding protein [Limnochordaceae bacterium]|nr:ABC transporter ATP-binding protein [Limnochordaceae bacterium]
MAVEKLDPSPITQTKPLVQVDRLKKYYPIAAPFRRAVHFVHAVDDVSFQIRPGHVFGLVGESGCGKTTTGRVLVRLTNPTSGRVLLEEKDIFRLTKLQLVQFRQSVQMMFQDPYESLNPRMTIFDIVSEPLDVNGIGSLREREERIADMLNQVGLTPPQAFLFRFPHELSGGQRQRVAIARALVTNPRFVVADEPTSMLDVSIRTGIMQLLAGLREKLGISYLYITHDLAVARYLCDDIAVMYLGKIVEQAPAEQLLRHPLHPYTRALISAVPVPDPSYQRPPVNIKGGVSRPVDPPPRCRFYERCPLATRRCANEDHPPLVERDRGHWVACYEV